MAVPRNVHLDVLRIRLDVAEETVASSLRLALETYRRALDGSVSVPARTRRKVDLKNPGLSHTSTGVNDAMTWFLRRASMTSEQREFFDFERGRWRDKNAGMAASHAGLGAVIGNPKPPSSIDERKKGGWADLMHGDSPLSDNEETVTRNGAYLLGDEGDGAPEEASQAGTVFNGQLNRGRCSGPRRRTLEDLNRPVKEKAAMVQILFQAANLLAAQLCKIARSVHGGSISLLTTLTILASAHSVAHPPLTATAQAW